MSTPDRYKAIIGQYFEKLNAFDPALLEVFSDHLRYIVPGNMPVSGTYHGKDEVMAMWLRFFERLEFIKVHPQEMIAEGRQWSYGQKGKREPNPAMTTTTSTSSSFVSRATR